MHSNPTARFMRRVSSAIPILRVAGCASITLSTPPLPDPPGRFVALTRPVIALGDTQEHESTGFPGDPRPARGRA